MTGAANAGELRADARRERRRLLLLSGPGLAWVTVLLLLPVGWLFVLSMFDGSGHSSLVNYERLLQPLYVRTFLSTLQVSALVTLACVLLGFPVAYLLSQLPGWLASLGLMLVMIPFWTSVLVRTYAWLVLLQRHGVVNNALISVGLTSEPLQLVHNFTGTVIGMTHVLLPFLILPLHASMCAISGDYLRAAANCGAGPVRRFWSVFMPLCMPGLTSGVILVFVLCMSFYVTPTLLGGGKVSMWSMQIESNIALYSNWGAASALGVLLLVVTLLLLWGLRRLLGANRTYADA